MIDDIPNAVLGKDLFWACTRVAFFVSVVTLWYRERKSRKEMENPAEPANSLRRRTRALADEIELFLSDRFAVYRTITGNSEDPIEPKQKQHQQQTIDMFRVKFSQRLKGLSQEMEAIGINTEIHPGTVLSKTAFRQSRFGQAVSGRSILRLTD
jgi:hypothetical protein